MVVTSSSFLGNEEQQLILWKIKKKQSVPVIILKIFDTMVMEQKIENLILGQWNHLCQYWHGSIGLWALFLNSYIVSFDYIETVRNIKIYTKYIACKLHSTYTYLSIFEIKINIPLKII